MYTYMLVYVYTKGMKAPATTLRAVAYLRVSTEDQAASGLGLDAQAAAIETSITSRGWAPLVATFSDEGVSGKISPEERDGMAEALELLDSGQADVLVVAKLDRLTRSVAALATFLDRASKADWSVVILDADVDTTSAGGRLVANVLGSVAEWERMVIGERTKAALAQLKADGVKLGRPNEQSAENLARIAQLRSEGLSIRATAAAMNSEGRITARGGRWHVSTVQRALRVTENPTV